MISGHNTTDDWQKHVGTVAVLPVGAFEQHGPHLPLDTDIRCAQYFARLVAKDLNAVLLAVQPFGTSFEHTGFRGSITLRPETLMNILRDVAQELESQQFKLLIVLNGHGGNFALAPAVREWNRADRALKIILVGWWEFSDASLMQSAVLDVHAGDFETSVMMVVAPDLVRTDCISSEPIEGGSKPQIPLRQSDLNTFGVGHFVRHGAFGSPTEATAEKGQAIVASVKENMMPFLRDRIERLRRQPKYSAAAGIALRALSENDLNAAMRLKEIAGWNQTERDWRAFLSANSQGSYAAVRNGAAVGTATTIRYENRIAWIGMVLVDPDFRRMGIGKMLLKAALDGVNDVSCVKLDATPDGKRLYDTLGFVDESTLQRWVCAAPVTHSGYAETGTLRRATAGDLDAIIELDAQTFGATRTKLLKSLLEAAPSAWCLIVDGKVLGFCLGREGTRFYHIGSVVAENFGQARCLVGAVLNELRGRPVMLDVPDAQHEFTDWLQSLGFVSQRPLIRMRRGAASSDVDPQRLFAICGPEFG